MTTKTRSTEVDADADADADRERGPDAETPADVDVDGAVEAEAVTEAEDGGADETEPTVQTETETMAANAEPTNRWEVGVAVALLAVSLGIFLSNTAIFLSAVVGLTYAAYGYAVRPPEPKLSVERHIQPDSPAPGEDVTVTLTVTNEATEPISDLRIVDEPPEELVVGEGGHPSAAVTLQPGETTTLEYTVCARRGTYSFGGVTLLVRNVNGAAETRERLSLETEFECADVLERVPLAGQTNQHTGRVETNVGGEGLEFYSIRSYHPSDPMNRVDWNRLARTGELTTVEFREERAASVVVVVDCRAENAVVREETELDALALSKHAAGWFVGALLSENNRVGVACYGGTGHYLLPRSGRDQVARATRLLEGTWCGSYGRPGWLSKANAHVGRFCEHLAAEKQIVFVTPVLDVEPIDSARRFRAYGHAVTLVCPAVARGETIGGTIDRLEHRQRVRTLREHGVRVIEWDPAEPLHVAVDRAKRVWSR